MAESRWIRAARTGAVALGGVGLLMAAALALGETAEPLPETEPTGQPAAAAEPETAAPEAAPEPVEIPPFVYPELFLQGDPDVPKGDMLQLAIDNDPSNLNPVTSKDYSSSAVNSWITESLTTIDVETYERFPGIADRWMIRDLPDGRQEFYFHVDESAYFSDGHPITADDVVFSYEIYFDDDVPNFHRRPVYWHIAGIERVDEQTVKFTTKDRYYLNFDVAAALEILPRHIYEPFFRALYKEKRDIDTIQPNLNLMTHGSGSYKLREWSKGKQVILERDKNYWGRNKPKNLGVHNMDFIVEKLIRDEKISYEYFKKGETDYYAFTPRQWVQEADQPAYSDGTLIRMEILDWKRPSGYSYIGWNNVDPEKSDVKNLKFEPHKLFGDRRVRLAMTHLVDRQLYCDKLAFGYSEPTTGPFGNRSPYSNAELQPWPFDPARALELLREAGWADTDDDGVLDKLIDGRKADFRFTLLIPQGIPETVAFCTIIQADMRKAGVVMQIREVEWNSFQKLTDEKNFDAMSMAWSGVINPDPIPIWHSSSARSGGYNMIGYSNPELDRLCEEAVAEMDRDRRLALFHRIHTILHDDQPYTFLTAARGALIARNGRIRTQTSNVTGKDYYQYNVGYAFWYIPKELQRPPRFGSSD